MKETINTYIPPTAQFVVTVTEMDGSVTDLHVVPLYGAPEQALTSIQNEIDDRLENLDELFPNGVQCSIRSV